MKATAAPPGIDLGHGGKRGLELGLLRLELRDARIRGGELLGERRHLRLERRRHAVLQREEGGARGAAAAWCRQGGEQQQGQALTSAGAGAGAATGAGAGAGASAAGAGAGAGAATGAGAGAGAELALPPAAGYARAADAPPPDTAPPFAGSSDTFLGAALRPPNHAAASSAGLPAKVSGKMSSWKDSDCKVGRGGEGKWQ